MEVTCVRKLLIFGLVATLLIGVVYAMPWIIPGPKHGMFATMTTTPVQDNKERYGYYYHPCYAYWQNVDEFIDTSELKKKARELISNSEIKNRYIVKDGIIYGILFKNISIEEVKIGEPVIMMFHTLFPLYYNGNLVGYLHINNFELGLFK